MSGDMKEMSKSDWRCLESEAWHDLRLNPVFMQWMGYVADLEQWARGDYDNLFPKYSP